MVSELAVSADDPLLDGAFMREIVRQVRAIDSYGVWEGVSDRELLDPFVVTRERRREIPLVGDPDEETLARVSAFYNAIAVLIESECGRMAVSLVHLSHEGFGRVVITVGKLVVLDKSLRDVHRFGFESLSRMKDEADKLLSVAIGIIGQHPDVAGM
jgi:probable nitrogen fixation protein